MGECGCAVQPYDEAHRIKGSRVTLAVQTFPGCEDCDYGPGITVAVFDSPKVEWIDGVEVQTVVPDDCGANQGRGIPITMFDKRDYMAAAKEVIAQSGPPVASDEFGIGDTEAITEWLEENAMRIAHRAVVFCRDREQERARAEKAKAQKGKR